MRSQSENPIYLLNRHVFICQGQTHTILLDLRKDRYLAVTEEQAEVLCRFVPDWPVSTRKKSANGPQANATALLVRMTQAGILTTSQPDGKTASPIAIPTATSTFVGEYHDTPARIGAARLRKFIVSVAEAGGRLRMGGLESTVRRLQTRRSEVSNRMRTSAPLAAMRDATDAFEFLRPLFLTQKDGCLLNSVALVEFLSHEELHPLLVIGVRTRPFAAHCWVQEGPVVLNDLPEQIRKFVPILAV